MTNEPVFFKDHVVVGGVKIYADMNYTDVDSGWTTKDIIKAFPYGCKVSLDTEGLGGIGKKAIGKVVGYWDDHVLIYNPENTGHSGGSFFEENEHLWKDYYSKKCWWFSFTRIRGVRNVCE